MTRIEESSNKISLSYRIVSGTTKVKNAGAIIKAVSLDGIEKVVVSNNGFAIKYRILRGAPEGKYLLYFPYAQKQPGENWLLDIQLATRNSTPTRSPVFARVGAGLLLQRACTGSTSNFSRAERRARLKNYLAEGDNEQELRFKMMAVVFGSEYFTLEAYIQAYAAAFISGDTRIEKELERFRLGEAFWRGQ
ncbi:MAG: hypothetical protein IPN33_22750 [Saprospiraceae bacterium]|nr:hypothetical protein [Saprospiraceae bacterium]